MIFGVLALFLVELALGSGMWWVSGGDVSVFGFNLLNWHILLGFVFTAAMVLHMFVRAKRLCTRDIVGRRRVIQFSALFIGGVARWPAEQFTQRLLNLPGAKQRFTGSREIGSYAGNTFPPQVGSPITLLRLMYTHGGSRLTVL